MMCRQTGNREMSNRMGENGAEVTKGETEKGREKEIHRCTYFYVIAVEAMHCCRETKANVAEKLRGKDEVRDFVVFGTSVGGLKRVEEDIGMRRGEKERDKIEWVNVGSRAIT